MFPMESGKSVKTFGCPVEATLSVIGGKWKVPVLYYLLEGTKRFNELERLLTGISHRTLARQLKELERDRIVQRRAFPEVPPRVEYSWTARGQSLEPVLRAMDRWGQTVSPDVPNR